jgi:hypothetical protein
MRHTFINFQRSGMDGTESSSPTFKDKTSNQINVIHPFKKNNVWVFNDPEVNLYEEPFVSNVNPLIDTVVTGDSFTAFISHSFIPNAQIVLEQVLDSDHSDIGDGWYQMQGTGLVCWLCPATLKYFKDYPDMIYVRIKQ